MKKYIIIISFLLIFTSIGYTENNYDFRNTNWGMTSQEVIDSEPLKLIANQDNQLFYITSILTRECYLFYNFQNNDKLSSAGYFFQIKHTNFNSYIDDYFEVQDAIVSKYGEPLENNRIWTNDLFKDNEQFWGTAISMGYLQYKSTWETEKTKIILKLYGDNYEIHLGLIYGDKSYVPEAPSTKGL